MTRSTTQICSFNDSSEWKLVVEPARLNLHIHSMGHKIIIEVVVFKSSNEYGPYRIFSSVVASGRHKGKDESLTEVGAEQWHEAYGIG
ncbi:unnamed protein product [Haemonchus placei]|uniref:SUN domain-containing protein n=1 Tax=Haemonchus placei TaxID=6290 RepID=A0A0N4W513_HAEPC|nr:unnamed protein product [Haemonchus placei]